MAMKIVSFRNSGLTSPATMVLAAGFYLGDNGIYIVKYLMLGLLDPSYTDTAV
jgi:hypothetical protein